MWARTDFKVAFGPEFELTVLVQVVPIPAR